eukprot:GGOE01062411.1.p4 GENE.GGOE01062411.1~~GGOE01062411.1.p4  ORF type:complete len:128 (-),score=1.59 GGOE01062411.1:312-695(-)
MPNAGMALRGTLVATCGLRGPPPRGDKLTTKQVQVRWGKEKGKGERTAGSRSIGLGTRQGTAPAYISYRKVPPRVAGRKVQPGCWIAGVGETSDGKMEASAEEWSRSAQLGKGNWVWLEAGLNLRQV